MLKFYDLVGHITECPGPHVTRGLGTAALHFEGNTAFPSMGRSKEKEQIFLATLCEIVFLKRPVFESFWEAV